METPGFRQLHLKQLRQVIKSSIIFAGTAFSILLVSTGSAARAAPPAAAMKITTTLTVLIALFTGWINALGAPLRIHMISGSEEYRSEASLKEFAAYLRQSGIECSASWAKDKGTRLPNLGPLPPADLLIVFARRLTLPEEQMKIVRAHWEAGKPVIGIRTASHAWGAEDNAIFDRKVLGNNYAGHYRDVKTKVTNVAAQNAHPILNGVRPFTSRKLYKAGELAPTATALQFGDNGEGRHVVTLVNEYKGGRVFYTSLGVPEDFKDENFRRMLVNAIYWTTRR
jgi:type 1 glutamine amidotransferase